MLKENTALVVIPAILEPFVVQGIIQLDGSSGPLTSEQEEALCAYVDQGGGLLCLGCALENYHEYPRLGEMLGNVAGACTPETELIIRVANNDHYLTRRTDPEFAIVESVYLLQEIPEDAEPLWQTSWHYTRRPVAYTRRYGRGQIICTILGTTPATLSHPNLQQFLGRAYRYLQGAPTEEKPARVAMIGYGAIGFEHGSAITAVPGLEYSLVCDRNPDRLAAAEKAFPGIRTCTELADLEHDPEIDLVIISTPPNTHAEIALQMLRAGKHVVCEKPFCLTTAEAEEMIKVAREKQLTLTIYQCRRWDPDYLAIQRVIQSGAIGKVFHIETFIGGYGHPCDYWHSHEPISGGVFYDWGSHYLDWILQLIPQRVVSVRGTEHKRVWHDVTNADQSSVHIRFADGQEAEFLHSDIAAALKPKWYILGEKGAIVGNWRHETIKSRRWSGDLIEEQLAPSEALPELQVYTREPDGAIHTRQLMLLTPPAFAFHRNLANHLHSGEALAVPPEEARRNITVMEAAKYSAEHESETIPLDC